MCKYIYLIFLIISCKGFSMPPEFSAPLTVMDGLSDNRVYAIEQDESGYIWIATANGLNRFDGNNFTIFNTNNSGLLHNVIYEIKKGPPHFLLLATRYGAIMLDTRTGVMKPFLVPGLPELKNIANDVRHVEFTSKNEIILGTHGGIYVFDLSGNLLAKHEAKYDLNDIGIKRLFFIRNISAFTNGDLLAATLDGFFYYDSDLKTIVSLNKLPEKHNSIKHFLRDHKQSYVFEINKWNQLYFIDHIAAIDSLYIVDVPKNEVYTQALPFHSKGNIRWDTQIKFYDDSIFTITTAQRGFFIYSQKNAQLPVIISQENAKNARCNYVFRDRHQKYWIGTEFGIMQQKISNGIVNTNILPFVKNGSYHPIIATLATKDKIWVGSYSRNGGLVVLDKEFNFLKRIDFIHDYKSQNFIVSISNWSADTILVGTVRKAYLVNIHDYKFHPFTIQSVDSIVKNIRIVKYFQSSNGESWISEGGSKGVWKINKTRDKIHHFKPGTSKNNIPLRNASDFAEDLYGNIWIVNWMDGLTRWNYKKQMFDTVIRKWPGNKVNYFLCSGIVIDNKNNFWFYINSYGLIKFDLQKNIIKRIVASSDEADDNVNSLLLVKNNYIWMNLRHSILAYNIETGKLTSLSSSIGLPTQPNSSSQLYFDHYANKVLAGFSNQLSAIPLKLITGKNNKYPFYITGVKDLRKGTYLNFLKPLILNNNQNNLKIEFSQVNYDPLTPKPFLEYKLKDNATWAKVGSQTSLNLNNLSPGNYQLQLREASLFEGNSTILDTLTFEIKPPFYQTTWFYLLLGLIVLVLFYIFYHFRIQQIKRVHVEKERIASDLHDDIGSRLTHIRILSVLGDNENIPKVERDNYLKKINEEALASGEALDEIVRNINVPEEELIDITARMRRFAEEILEDVSIGFKMSVDEKIGTRQLALEKKRDLFMAFKEIMNNIQKHANAKNVEIMIYDQKSRLVIDVKDDGIGFKTDENTSRNGLKNICSRMNKWGGNSNFISGKNSGTQIIIQMPY